MGSSNVVNQQGSTLSDADHDTLYGIDGPGGVKVGGLRNTDPTKFATMLNNWLTSGKPKPVNPGETFKQAQDVYGLHEKASAGAGIGGLFGLGLMIGDLSPKVPTLTPNVPSYGMKPVPGVK